MPHSLYPESLATMLVAEAGKQWTPSNGTEGGESWCGQCQRDKAMRDGVDIDDCDDNERCDIIARSFAGEATDWQIDAKGQPCCTQFVPAGQAIPAPRCAHTPDMFGEPQP